jgi:hypothetical protein
MSAPSPSGSAPPLVAAAVGDLFFQAKLAAMAARAGAAFLPVKADHDLASLSGRPVRAFVIDLESRSFDPGAMFDRMAAAWPAAERWAFAAHGSLDAMAEIRGRGRATVLSRGAFEAKFPEFLRTLAGR